MKPVTNGGPPDVNKIDPKAEQERAQRLEQLRTQYDAAVARLGAAKQHQKDLQDALIQLQGELNQTEPQLLPVQQDAAAKRVVADALKPRIDELRAARDAVTARLLGGIDI